MTTDNHHTMTIMTPQLKELLEKIQATGSACLTQSEALAVSEIFRRAAMGDRYMLDVSDKIKRAHLDHCLSMPAATDAPD